MNLIIFFIILFAIIIVPSSAVYKINKCCPDGQMYSMVDDYPICVPAKNPSSKYNWLPQSVNETIINNLKINFSNSQCSEFDAEWSVKFSLIINENSIFLEDEIIFKDSSFCLDKFNYNEKNLTVARECPCLEQICIPKCCESGKHLNDTFYCIDSGHTTDWMFDKLNETITEKYKTTYKFPQCNAYNKTLKYVTKYKLNSNGSITTNVVTVIEPTEYCGDYKHKNDGSIVETIIACFDEITISTESIVYGIMSLVGAFFFLITAIFLFWIPELGGSPKWSMAFHVLCFFVAYMSLAYQQLSPSLFGKVFCQIIAFVMQFSFMTSFFWLNVMCINFSLILAKALRENKYTEKRKFVGYSLYAWIGASLITLVTIIVEFSPIVDEYSPFKPNFGKIKCWFITSQAVWLYFFGPIGTLLLFNLILFVYASIKLIILKRELEISENEGNRKKNNNKIKRRFLLLLKLLFLMGILWITEIVSWIFDNSESAWHYVWYFTDTLNLMRAVFIFIIFCCTKRARHKIDKKAPWIRRSKIFIMSFLCRKVTNLTLERNGQHSNCSSSGSLASEINGISLKSIEK